MKDINRSGDKEPNNQQKTSPGFLALGGDTGALMRAQDWSSTPFGPPECWPQSLRSAVSICLGTKFPIAIYWGPELALLYNDAWSDIPGEKHPWALGRPGREVWPEIWDAIGPLFEKVLATGEGVWQEDQLLPMHRHGYTEECYFNFTFSPIRGENGTVEGIFNAVVETTFRVIGERRERTLRELAECIAAARSEHEVFENAYKLLSDKPEDIPFCIFYRCDEDGNLQKMAWTYGTFGADEYVDVASDDALWVKANLPEMNKTAMVDGLSVIMGKQISSHVWPEPVERALVVPFGAQGINGPPAGYLVAGISPRRELDEDYTAFVERAATHVGTALATVRAFEEERSRAEALAEIDRAKTTFFSNVSHEFRTPLTLMLGPLEDALSHTENSISRERIEMVHRNGLRLLKLVNSLLDFSRIEAGRAQANIQATDLAQLTAELASNFRSAMEKAGLRYSVTCQSLSRPVPVDRDMWEKIVLNLLSNAFKFTFEGEISVDLREVAGAAVLTIRDSGTGIPSHELPKLFERFHRIEGARGRSIEGSGIGLALVQELVRFHEGSVKVESVEGQGTTFAVSIPLGNGYTATDTDGADRVLASTAVRAESFIQEALRWLPDEEAATSSSTTKMNVPAATATLQAPRILLADDNADMRDYVRRLLAGAYRVDVVSDGLAALDAIRQDRPDLLLTDIMMPRLDGFGLIRAIREDDTLRDLPIIALSAKAGEEAKVEGLDVGADDYLVKPFSARELVAVVHSVLELAKVRRDTVASLRESEERFRNMADHAPVMMWVTDEQASCTYLNRGWYEFTGQTEVTGLGYGWLDATHPQDKAFAEQVFLAANEKHEGFRIEYRLRRADGEYRWAIDAGAPRFNERGEFVGYVGSVIDITDRKRIEGLRAAQARLLESAMLDVPLETILDDLVRMVESLSSSGVVASVLLADDGGKYLRHGAAPNLPDAYNDAVDGIEISPDVGSCGAAAFLKRPVYVNDIENDPLWANFRDLALAHGLRACWSSPILSSDGKVLGTFALYYGLALEASSSDRDLLEFVSGSAALIIERRYAQEALRQQTNRLEALNNIAGALAGELDLERLVRTITDAGVELTGAQFGTFLYNIVNDETENYTPYASSGVPRLEFEKFSMPHNTAVFAPTFTRIIRSDDITANTSYDHDVSHRGMPDGLPVRSYMAVPVMSTNGAVIGALFFGHQDPKRFTVEHEGLLSGIASQASVAFDNAQLFKTAQKEIEQRRAAEQDLSRLNTHLEERVTDEVEKRAVAEQALQQAQKMEAIGQLTGGIAHDFNNLLQVVAGNLQLLSKDIAGNDIATRRVTNALAGVERGAKLASQLLSFGRRQALEPKVVNIGRFIADIEEMLRRTLGEGVEVETIRGGGLWNASVDPVQVENAILNLAINARDAMDGHGKLTIEVGNTFLDDEYARQHDEVAAGQYVMLAVTDTGSGISPEIIEQVFEPFFSTKPVGKGTGLGLSMVYGFVKQSGGHIKIYSEVGHGTTIKLYFPRVRQDEDLFAPADMGPISGGTETILVAEDDEGVRNTVVEMLSDLGYAVLKAKDASAAMTIVESGIHIDLLFTDVVMPGPLKSADMARQAKIRQPHLAVLFTSGYTENSIVHGGKLDVGLELLSKPYTREALARKLRHVLNNQKQKNASAVPATTVMGQLARPLSPKSKILLVEDDALIRMATCDMLVDLGQTVIEAGSAHEALAALAKEPVDILITDLGLPGMSGDDLARQIRRDYPQIFIIFATGQSEMPELDGERKALLRKPYSREEIEHLLSMAAYS